MLIGKYKFIILFILIFDIKKFCLSENINVLGIVTSTSISNHIHASAVFDYLATTGDAVTVISPFPQSRRVNHISLEDLLENNKDKKKYDRNKYFDNEYQNKEKQTSNWFTLYENYNKGLERTATIVQHKNLTELLTIRRPPLYIDVIILDYDYNEALIGLGAIYNCPVFILTKGEPRGLLDPTFSSRTNHEEHSFTKNIQNLAESIIEKLYVHFIYFKKQEKLFNQFNYIQKNLSFSKLFEQHLSKIFITSISAPYSTITDSADVTGVHINDRKQSYLRQSYVTIFPEALDKFIHTASDGIIYVSLGKLDLINDMTENDIKNMFKVLNRRKEKIIWSWNGNMSIITSLVTIKYKFFISEWLPQSNIMEHSNVKLFITNCGHLSLIESFYFEIPILGFPITNEQKHNCNGVNEKNMGKILNLENFSAYEMNRTIEEILDLNPRLYMQNVQRKSAELNKNSISPKKIIQTTIKEIVEQRKIFGLKRTFVRKTPFYKAFMMEPILIVLFLVVFVVLVFIFISILLILRNIYGIYNEYWGRRKCKLY